MPDPCVGFGQSGPEGSRMDLRRTVPFVLLTAWLSGCDAPQTTGRTEASILDSELGSSSGPTDFCQLEFASLPDTLELFEVTRQRGGRTCFRDGVAVAFVHALPDNAYLDPEDRTRLGQQDVSTTLMTHDEAEAQFLGCSAILAQGSASNVEVVIFDTRDASIEDSVSYDLNIQAMITNDALPVQYHGFMNKITCLETSIPDVVLARVEEAEMRTPESVSIHRGVGTCQDLGGALAQGWFTRSRAEPS